MKIRNLIASIVLMSIAGFTAQAANIVSSPNGKFNFDVSVQRGKPYIVISSSNNRFPLEKIRLCLSYIDFTDSNWK